MKHLFKYIIILVTLTTLFNSCDEPAAKEPEIEIINLPAKSQAALPVNNETCSDFSEVAGDNTKADILFKWSAAEFAKSYVLQIFESQTEIFNANFTLLEANVILNKGKSYTWTITAKNNNGETASDTFSFTAPGQAIGNYAPYAAQISIDFDMITSEMNVSWIGSDEDGDELTFDVTVKEDGELISELVDLTTNSLNPIVVSANSVYEIQVISKDDFGNFSISKTSKLFSN